MQLVDQLEAMEALLKALDKGIRQFRAEYQYASATVKGLKKEYQAQEAGALGSRFEHYCSLRQVRHNQLADLVPASRRARVWLMQGRKGVMYGSFGSVAEPLLGCLMEQALAGESLSAEHCLWEVPLGPFMLLRGELPVVNLAYVRGGRKFEASLDILLSKGAVTLRNLRPLLLGAMGLPQVSLCPSELTEDIQFSKFLDVRAMLQTKLAPEAYELIKAYSQFL